MMRALVSVLALLPLLAAGSEQETRCPSSMPAEALAIRAPDGWSGFSPSIMRLTGVGMMAGPPESMAYLVPYKSMSTKSGGTSTWIFPDVGEKWLYCLYGNSASIQISKRLGDAATECTVRHVSSKFGSIEEVTVVCRGRRP